MENMENMPVPAENQLAETDEQKLARLATEINTIKILTTIAIIIAAPTVNPIPRKAPAKKFDQMIREGRVVMEM